VIDGGWPSAPADTTPEAWVPSDWRLVFDDSLGTYGIRSTSPRGSFNGHHGRRGALEREVRARVSDPLGRGFSKRRSCRCCRAVQRTCSGSKKTGADQQHHHADWLAAQGPEKRFSLSSTRSCKSHADPHGKNSGMAQSAIGPSKAAASAGSSAKAGRGWREPLAPCIGIVGDYVLFTDRA